MTLITSLLCTIILLALGGALLLTSMTETEAAAGLDRGVEAFHAAEGILERAMQDLVAVPDWATVFDGTTRSSFVDGAPAGSRALADGTAIDLDLLTTDVNGWRSDDGSWRLFAYGPARMLLPGDRIDSPMYGVVWVSADPGRPGAAILLAHAYGPLGTRRMVDVSVTRTAQQTLRVLAWRELRQ